jgi:hypothetical protein
VFLLVSRVWLVTARGEMNDDPVRFMMGDRPSGVLLVLSTIFFAVAWLA